MKGKSLAKNSAYNVIYQFLNAVFPLITAAYVARILLAGGVGKVAYAQNIVKYFSIIAALGIPNYGIREISKTRENEKNTSIVFSELLTINTISTTVCLIAYYSFVCFSPLFHNERMLFLVVGLNIFFNFFNVDWFYRGFEEYKYIAIRSFIVKIVSLIAVFVFVRKYEDYSIYALITCLGVGGNNVYNFFHINKYKVKLSLRNINCKKHLKPIIILLGSAIAVELYTLLDTTMIGAICEPEAVGYYTDSMRIIKILITIITAIGGALLPRLSYYHSIGNQGKCDKIVSKVFSVLFFLFIPCELGVLLVSEQIIPVFFGNGFLPAVTTLRIGSLLICILGFSNLFGTQVLLTYGNEKKLMLTTIAGAITNILLNSFLIPGLQQNGAAIASVVSETVVTVLSIIYAKKYITLTISRPFILKTCIAALIMTLCTALVQFSNLNLIIKLTLSVTIGVITYAGANIIIKNPILIDLLSIVKKEKRDI